MALSSLAEPGDLWARGITPASSGAADALLAAASAVIREAAGCSITSSSVTVEFFAGPSQYLALPGYGITAVTEVTIDGVAVTDWKRVGNRLFRANGWDWCENDPPIISVTYTQGFTDAPDDIVDLCCSLVAAGVAAMADGYDPHANLSSESIDDYRRTFMRGEDARLSPMELPRATRDMLRRRFSTSTRVTGALR